MKHINPANMDTGNLDTTMIARGEFRNSEEAINPYIYILQSNNQYKRYKLNQQYTRFGRGPGVDIIQADPSISRRHAIFILTPEGIYLEDSNSTNGTYVDGKRVEKTKLSPASRIHIGQLEVKIEYKTINEIELEDSIFFAANTDCLTQLANRRKFMERATEELSYSQRNNSKISIIICDIDHFKQTNDNFGHPVGDEILKQVADLINSSMRKEDLLARYGGEEFIILLRDTNEKNTQTWAEKVRRHIADNAFYAMGQTVPTTLSFGICTRNGKEINSLDDMIETADLALYKAKAGGRNRVSVKS